MPPATVPVGPLRIGDAMPLEDLVGPNKFLNDLTPEWPLGIDPFSEGDDHIRGLKNVIGNSFPTVAEARYPVSFEPGPLGAAAEEKHGAIEMAAGTTAQRPSSPSTGATRLNTETGYIETWNGLAWANRIAVTDLENVFYGGAGNAREPVMQWSANVAPVVNQYYPQLIFNVGDGPGGINMGSFRWYTSPDDVGRHRFAVRTNNGGFANRLSVGAGVMVPTSDNPGDVEDPGRGYVNAKNGYLVDGKPVVEVFESAQQVISANSVLSQAHGLSAKPQLCSAKLVCVTADRGYLVGHEISYGTVSAVTDTSNDNDRRFNTLYQPDATTVELSFSDRLRVGHRTNGGTNIVDLNFASWRCVLQAYRFNGT